MRLLQLVVEGELQDAQWQATKKWTNEYLTKAAVSTSLGFVCLLSALHIEHH